MLLKRLMKTLAGAVPAAMVLSCVGIAAAGDPGGWQFEATLYGWYAGMDSEVRFPGPLGRESDMTVDASDIINHLNMVYMGGVEARNNRWSIVADLVYLNLGDDAATTVRIGSDPGYPATASAELDFTSWIVSGGVGYDLLQAERGRLALMGGVRYLSVDVDGQFGLGGPFPLERSRSEENWDGIVGLRGALQLSERWYLPFHADIGAGDSDLTWQLFAGIGYRFSWGDIRLGYRYLSYDLDDDTAVQDLAISGPVLGVGIRF